MKSANGAFTGNAGVFFVASRFSAMGYHVGITNGNVPYVDVIVSNDDGSASVAIQVKSTGSAARERGRGTERCLHHYEWDIGRKCARVKANSKLLFALVDFKHFKELPDIYLLPASKISDYFNQWKALGRYRYHMDAKKLSPYRNNWKPLKRSLGCGA